MYLEGELQEMYRRSTPVGVRSATEEAELRAVLLKRALNRPSSVKPFHSVAFDWANAAAHRRRGPLIKAFMKRCPASGAKK